MDQTWPDPIDSEAWLDVSASGRLSACPPGAVVTALRAQMRVGHRSAANALAQHLSGEITRCLRRMIGLNHPDAGEPMIERAHGEMMKAVFDPAHSDHEALEEAFAARLAFRALDAIRVERRHNRRHPSYDGMAGGLADAQARQVGGQTRSMTVEQAIARIADPRKRLAFRLYVEGAQVRAGRNNIAEAVGIDPKTAAKWIVEIRATLAAAMNAEIGA